MSNFFFAGCFSRVGGRTFTWGLIVIMLAVCYASPNWSQEADYPQAYPQTGVAPTNGISFSKPTCGCGQLHPPGACLGPCQPCIQGVDCLTCSGAEARWQDMRPIDFQPYGHGEYAGPPRLAHLAEYRLRPNDELQMIYLITRRQSDGAYRLTVGDEVLIESILNDELQRGTLERGLRIQPDGTITPPVLGQVHAAGLTVDQLRKLLESRYKKFYPEPSIDVTPVKTNSLAEDIRNAVGGQSGLQQQAVNARVMPDGKIRLPGVGALCVQGLTLSELKQEINLRYGEVVVGLEVEPLLVQQAPSFIYVVGEVFQSNRFQIQAPTTVLGAIALAGGYQTGANMRQVVVLRRADDWRLMATMLDLQGALLGKRPTPADEIWLRDGDVVIVPKSSIRVLNDFVQQVFTNGVYGVAPFLAFGQATPQLTFQ